jgi:deoxyribodipyrimidine photo-lyase
LNKEAINIVWMKRDLRTQDHEPLFKAEQEDIPYIIIYVFEPSIIKYPDTSPRHLQFVYHSIQHLNTVLNPFKRKINLFYGEFIDVFEFLQHQFLIKNIFSYQESGTNTTYNRDKKIAFYCTKNAVKWKEFQRDGILRGVTNRDDWSRLWHQTMHSSVISNQYSIATLKDFDHPFQLEDDFKRKLETYPKQYQPAGEKNGWRYLESFVSKRGFEYHRNISKPVESRVSCSRLSPYLAWGNMSIRQVYRFVGTHPNGEFNKRAFTGVLTRLHWHCHFIQKFEVECSYETLCVNKGYELLEHKRNEEYIKAWKSGITGFPLIDACMRAVEQTGWINFRMRAMVVSFLTLNLDQDWRDGVYHLARQFLDYEPGIHYPQFQMQAGTTGINTVRLYNPVKNSQEHDSQGVFIKKWIPELENVPTEHIHEPYNMTPMEQVFCGVVIGEDYPSPIVDLKNSAKIARDKIWGHREHPAVKKENKRILRMHVNTNR